MFDVFFLLSFSSLEEIKKNQKRNMELRTRIRNKQERKGKRDRWNKEEVLLTKKKRNRRNKE